MIYMEKYMYENNEKKKTPVGGVVDNMLIFHAI